MVALGVTLFGIFKSRGDSYGLLVQQGAAFTEALALACQNTVVTESYYDRMSAAHYMDLVDELTAGDARRLTVERLTAFSHERDLLGAYVYDTTGVLLLSDVPQGPLIRPPAEVESAVQKLVTDFASRWTIVFRDDTLSGLKIHYFIEITNQLDRVIVLASDATLYDEARARTGIGVLAQQMASEPGIEYIVYQSKEGIIVSSRANGQFESIESEPFLAAALESDSIVSRKTEFFDHEVLELVRPFSTRKYPFGLLRVGVSLDRFVTVTRRFDQLMLVLALSLLGITAVGGLYLSGRKERQELRKDISDIRSITDQIFSEISTGVLVVSSDGTVRLANDAMQQMLGSSLAGKSIKSVENMPPQMVELLSSAGDIEECEVTITSGGKERVLLLGRSKLRVEGESGTGMVVVATDITQLKEYQTAATRKERLSEMGHLAAAVAHEIRNPLNAISIAAQRLESELMPEERRNEFAALTGQIRNETKRLNEIITRVLSLSRSGEKSDVAADVAACLSEFESLMTPEADRAGIRLRVRSETPMAARIDVRRLKEILLNLYNNAKEAIESSKAEHKEIAIKAIREGGFIKITVSDSGPGIPVEHRSKIFAPYFTTKEAGTGIGLASVHQIVEAAGGKLSVGDSELGGAAITILLPDSTR
jgi:nitrogen-specific signal transduction histidine kinase